MNELGRPVKGERKNVAVNVLLTKELSEKIKNYCEETGVSRNFIFRKLLADFLEKQDK